MLAGEAQATGQDGTTLSYNTKSSNESKKQLEIAVETARLKVAMEAATRRFLRRIDTDDESGDELRIFSHDPIISGPLVCQLCNTDFGSLHVVDITLGELCTLSDLCHTAVAGRCVRELMRSCQGYAYEASFPKSMTDAGTQQVVAFSHRLTSITFNACNALTDIGVIAVSQNCPQLMHITLDGCKHVTDVGLQSLARLCTQLATVLSLIHI